MFGLQVTLGGTQIEVDTVENLDRFMELLRLLRRLHKQPDQSPTPPVNHVKPHVAGLVARRGRPSTMGGMQLQAWDMWVADGGNPEEVTARELFPYMRKVGYNPKSKKELHAFTGAIRNANVLEVVRVLENGANTYRPKTSS